MTANKEPLFELTPINTGITFVNADSTNLKTILTAGAEGTRIDAINVCSNDTSAVNLAFYIGDGAADLYIGNVNIPIGSGYTTVVKVDALQTLKPAYLNFLVLRAGYTLKANAVVAVTAAKTVTVVTLGGNF
jgi:hypothetical protein